MIYLLVVRDILETRDTIVLMLSAQNIMGKLKEEKCSELQGVNSGICYLCLLGKKNRLRLSDEICGKRFLMSNVLLGILVACK